MHILHEHTYTHVMQGEVHVAVAVLNVWRINSGFMVSNGSLTTNSTIDLMSYKNRAV
jgi:hypothetical protein